MTILELSGKLLTLVKEGKGEEEIQILDEGALLQIAAVGTFANADTGTDQIVLTVAAS